MRDPSASPERRSLGSRMSRISAASQMSNCCEPMARETAWLVNWVGLPCCDGWERQCGSCGKRSAIHERVCDSGEAALAGSNPD